MATPITISNGSSLLDDAALIKDETGLQRLVGYVLDLSAAPQGRCWLDLDDRHLNRHGVLHGGIAATLLDTASGVTGSLSVDPAGRTPFLTIALSTNFVAPARTGRVTATGTLRGGGRSLSFIDAELTDDQGRLIATSTGTFKRVRP
ncbi:MAG: PaaI family thioesterase [Pseudomonadota bacterium]